MSRNQTKKPVDPVTAKLREKPVDDGIRTLSTGYRVKVGDISFFEIQEIATSLDYPPPPRIQDPDSDRVIENKDDPEYVRQCEAIDFKRGMLVLDAALIGVILVDGLPSDTEWLDMLKFKIKRGTVKTDLNLDNEIEKEYAFKKYVAFKSPEDWLILQDKLAEIQGATAKADKMFQSDPPRNGDSHAPVEEGSAW